MSEYLNLGAGETVPKTGEWRCFFCGEGGIADFIGGELLDRGVDFPGARSLQSHGRKQTVRRFEAGSTFPECPNCGRATGWSLVE